MNILLVLAMFPFLSTPYTSSDIVMQDEVYNRIHEYEHKIAWSSSSNRKLNRLSFVKIIDFENNHAWLIEEGTGRMIREDIYLAELEATRLAEIKLIEDLKNADEKIATTLPTGAIYVTDDGRVIYGNGKEATAVTSNDNRSYSVNFAISEDNTSVDVLEQVRDLFTKEDNLSVVGFASPDGVNPHMQMNLAYRRLTNISKLLESNGYKIAEKLGVVCSSDVEKSSCWKVDITVYRGNK